MNDKIGIRLGALCDPIADQLKAQGFAFDEKEVEHFQRSAGSITQLRFADLLTDSMIDKISQKLFKQIQRHVIKHNKSQKQPK